MKHIAIRFVVIVALAIFVVSFFGAFITSAMADQLLPAPAQNSFTALPSLPAAVDDAFSKGYVAVEVTFVADRHTMQKYCGGFLADKKRGLVITAYHCLPPLASQLHAPHVFVGNGVPMSYLGGYAQADLALLKMQDVPTGMAQLPYEEATVSEAVYGKSLQHNKLVPDAAYIDGPLLDPETIDGLVFVGIVPYFGVVDAKGSFAMITKRNITLPKDFLHVTSYQSLYLRGTRVDPGFSGSPVYDVHGVVVGIMSAGVGDPTIVSSAANFDKLIAAYGK